MEGRNFGVLSPLTWRLADLGAKHAFLKAGLGWGHMPLHMVKADLDSGALVKIPVDGSPRDMSLPMRVVFVGTPRRGRPAAPSSRNSSGNKDSPRLEHNDPKQRQLSAGSEGVYERRDGKNERDQLDRYPCRPPKATNRALRRGGRHRRDWSNPGTRSGLHRPGRSCNEPGHTGQFDHPRRCVGFTSMRAVVNPPSDFKLRSLLWLVSDHLLSSLYPS